MNEIIWAYDYGARSKSRWPAKHDTIFWYAKNPADYQFHLEESDPVPYMAPGLVGPEKAARGKTPTDTWWHTIVSPGGRENTGYPTQKPRGVIDRIVKVHSRPGDTLLDFFAGSGTLGASALDLGRHCILVDNNPGALQVMESRFAGVEVEWHGWSPSRTKKQFHLWKSPAAILKEVTLAVYHRPRSPRKIRGVAASKVTWIEGPLMDLSSSDIRAMIGKGKNILYLVREHVRRFITRKHLYGA